MVIAMSAESDVAAGSRRELEVTEPDFSVSDVGLHFTLPVVPAARVLHQIRTIPEVNRSIIRDSLGYSQPSVTRHVNALIDVGLVEQVQGSDRDTVQTGRPHSCLQVNGRHLVGWGVHIGVRSTALVVADGAGRVIRERTVPLAVQEMGAAEALRIAAGEILRLGAGLPEPAGIGLAFSTHIGDDGYISSEIYRWHEVPAVRIFGEMVGRSVSFATGVTAMAATELLSHPLDVSDTQSTGGSTLYFYAREVIAHAWMFHGAVHRPHHGRSPAAFQDIAAGGSLLVEAAEQHGHTHPLSNTSVLLAARLRGVNARDFNQLVRIADGRQEVRDILDERAGLLAEVIALAVDVVDPNSVVFAGEAFTLDPRSLRFVVHRLRESQGGPGSLRIQRADRHVLRDAARQVALYPLWQDPLGTLNA